MKNFLEHQSSEIKILAENINEKGNRELSIQAKWQHAGIVNSNNRRYRKEILAKEIAKINEKISKRQSIWGCAFHPSDNFGKPSDISHKWEKVWMESNGECMGILTILDTAAGRDLQVITKAGQIGISSRGLGTTVEREELINGKMTRFQDVNDDFVLISPGDFVTSPSVNDAYASSAESLKNLENQLNENNIFLEAIKYEDSNTNYKFNEGFVHKLMEMNYSRDIDMGFFRGSFEEWKKKGEPIAKASILVAEGKAEDIEEGLRLLNENLLADQISKRPERKKVSAKDVIWEARLSGCDPVELAEQINKSIEASEQLDNSASITVRTARSLLKEAMTAGLDIGDPAVRAKVLEGGKINQKKEPLSIDEEAKMRVEILRAKGTEVTVEEVKRVILFERAQEQKEAERLRKVEKKQRLVFEALKASATNEQVKKIIGE